MSALNADVSERLLAASDFRGQDRSSSRSKRFCGNENGRFMMVTAGKHAARVSIRVL